MDIIRKVSDDLNKYQKVILVEKDFCYRDEALRLLVGKEGIKVYYSGCPDYERLEDEERLISLYRMYEFSDRFVVMDNSDQFGTLWNYVKNGLLPLKEAICCYCN